MYDYIIIGNEIEEYFDGFNIRKNLMIKIVDLFDIDCIIDYCLEEGIYDIIKVDYKSGELEGINQFLFDEVLKIINSKIERYV